MSHGPYEHVPKQARTQTDRNTHTQERGRVLVIGLALNKQFDCDMADYKTIESGSHAPAWLMTHLLSWSASVTVMPDPEGEKRSHPPEIRGKSTEIPRDKIGTFSQQPSIVLPTLFFLFLSHILHLHPNYNGQPTLSPLC